MKKNLDEWVRTCIKHLKINGSLRFTINLEMSLQIYDEQTILLHLFETWGRFHQHFMSSFYLNRSLKRKKYSLAVSLFAPLGICTH